MSHLVVVFPSLFSVKAIQDQKLLSITSSSSLMRDVVCQG